MPGLYWILLFNHHNNRFRWYYYHPHFVGKANKHVGTQRLRSTHSHEMVESNVGISGTGGRMSLTLVKHCLAGHAVHLKNFILKLIVSLLGHVKKNPGHTLCILFCLFSIYRKRKPFNIFSRDYNFFVCDFIKDIKNGNFELLVFVTFYPKLIFYVIWRTHHSFILDLWIISLNIYLLFYWVSIIRVYKHFHLVVWRF